MIVNKIYKKKRTFLRNEQNILMTFIEEANAVGFSFQLIALDHL